MTIQTGPGHDFLEELPLGIHTLAEGSPSDTIKVAFYGPNAGIQRAYPEYTTNGEISGGGYTAGGYEMTGGFVMVGRQGSVRAAGPQFAFAYLQPAQDFEALLSGVAIRGLMVYNATQFNRNIFTMDFGQIITPSYGIKMKWGVNGITEPHEALIPLIGQTT